MADVQLGTAPVPAVDRAGGSAVESVPSRSFRARRLREPSSIGRKAAFLVRSLDYGGAQRQLVTLAMGLHQRGHEVVVVVFYPGAPLEAELRRAGVPLRIIGKRGRWDVAGFFRRLIRILREERPAILHGYLDVPNLVALLLRPLFPGLRLVWGVRASDMDLRRYDWLARLSFRALCRLARLPDLVIVNSWAGREHHRGCGFPEDRMRVISNGIDTERFAPDEAARRRIREEWGIADREPLVGLFGRLDPMKDHPTFLRAAALLAQDAPGVRFVCVGSGPPEYLRELLALARELGIGERLRWVEAQADVAALYNAVDLLCSSSAFGEGFSNVIGEAMACGVPCVASDVGDAALVVGETGLVVPPGDPTALAAALHALLDDPEGEQRRRAARQRIVDHFSVRKLLDRTEEALWATV